MVASGMATTGCHLRRRRQHATDQSSRPRSSLTYSRSGFRKILWHCVWRPHRRPAAISEHCRQCHARWRSIRLGGGGPEALRRGHALKFGLWCRCRLVWFRPVFRASSPCCIDMPINRSVERLWISASCNRDGKALAANSAKARAIDSLGTSPARCQPHKRRNVLSADSISICILAGGQVLNPDLRDKGPRQHGARVDAREGHASRPGTPRSGPIPRTLTSCR